jgi:hypothetical protein
VRLEARAASDAAHSCPGSPLFRPTLSFEKEARRIRLITPGLAIEIELAEPIDACRDLYRVGRAAEKLALTIPS